MDRIGRKPLMLTGVVGCCVCLIIEAAMIASFASPIPTDPSAINHAGLRMGVAALYVLHPTNRLPLNPPFIPQHLWPPPSTSDSPLLIQISSYIFLVFYGCGIDCAGVVFYSEIFPNHLHAKGVAMAIATIAITDLVYLQATSTAFANIGWKFFLVRTIAPSCQSIFSCGIEPHFLNPSLPQPQPPHATSPLPLLSLPLYHPHSPSSSSQPNPSYLKLRPSTQTSH
jgi:MFS family permease